MEPNDTSARYDRIAQWWQTEHQNSTYGIAQLERAIKFTSRHHAALDVGCGSSGRFINSLSKHGFQPEGLDISREMIGSGIEVVINPLSPPTVQGFEH